MNFTAIHLRRYSDIFMGLLNFSRFFPVMLIVCNASASVCYAVAGDFRRALYWAASTICVGAVTF